MITIKKLKTLKPVTRHRKYVRLLQGIEQKMLAAEEIDHAYLEKLVSLIADDPQLPSEIGRKAGGADCALRRDINGLRHSLQMHLGIQCAEWDMLVSEKTEVFKEKSLFPIRIYVDDIRSPFNIGSVFRTSECFGVEKVFLSPDSPSPHHPRAKRTAMGCADIVNWEKRSLNELGQYGPVFALETGGIPVSEFTFPSQGMCVIGSEELGISPEARELAESSHGLVSISLYGGKASLNVSVAFGILMHTWVNSLQKR
ncbi:MAG: TrmH family RNA methyltransferase [Spirochaetia bacterium]